MAEYSLQELVASANRAPWRESYGVHPAANLFPPLSSKELEELAADIKARGMLMPILVRRLVKRPRPGFSITPSYDVVDGRSRLDAMVLAGLPLFEGRDGQIGTTFRVVELPGDEDPYAVAISANLKRRHLTAAQRREAIAKVVAARPDQSDRQIAKTFSVDHKTVGAVRKQGIATGEVSPVERTTGADGKSRPVKRAPAKTTPAPAASTQRAAALEQPAEARRGAVEREEIEDEDDLVEWLEETRNDEEAPARLNAAYAALGEIAPRFAGEYQPRMAMTKAAIEEFAAGFGIVGDDLSRLFDLFREWEVACIVDDHTFDNVSALVEKIGVNLAEEYAGHLHRVIDRAG